MTISMLNANAPIFVPSAYRAVEDFSDEWWDLVQSCPWFRDYWLRECFSDPELDLSPFLGDENCVNEDSLINNGVTEGKGSSRDLVALGWLKWRKPRGEAEMPRYCEKVPKIVTMKVKPRAIQQPR